MSRFRRALVLLLACIVAPSAAAGYLSWVHAPVPGSAEILGIVGNIGEWEMTAKLERQGDTRELAGSDEDDAHRLVQPGWPAREGR